MPGLRCMYVASVPSACAMTTLFALSQSLLSSAPSVKPSVTITTTPSRAASNGVTNGFVWRRLQASQIGPSGEPVFVGKLRIHLAQVKGLDRLACRDRHLNREGNRRVEV